jgi:c-di-GMP-binding flagellar brake protein YcgR
MLWTTQRKTQRIHIAVRVTVRFEDPEGDALECEAWTLDVSKGGACLNLPDGITLPRRLRVVADDYQFRADADVEVVWERAMPQRAIGVRLAPYGRKTVWDAR